MRGAWGTAVLVGSLMLSAGPATSSAIVSGAPVATAATYYDAGNGRINARHDGFARGTPLRAGMKQRWSHRFRALGASVTETRVAGGVVFALVDDDDDQGYDPHPEHGHRLWALNLRTGKTIWARWFPRGHDGDSASRFGMAVGSGRVYVTDYHGSVSAYSTRTGKRLWLRTLFRARAGDLSELTAVGGRIYFFDTLQKTSRHRVGRVQVLDGATGRTVWQRPLKDQTGPLVSVAGRSVYISGTCQNTHRLNRNTGAVVWHHVKPGCSGGGGNVPVLHSSGVWIVEANEGFVLSGRTGRTVRTFAADIAPAIAGNTAVLLAGNTLSAVATGSGATRWQRTVDGQRVTAGPVISGRTAYLGGQDGYVIGYDLDSGAVVWNQRGGVGRAALGHIDDLTIADGRLVVTSGSDLAVYS